MSGDAPVIDRAIKTPVYAIANSWEVTTIYDASGAPLCVMSLRYFPVSEKNQDKWERRQKAKADFIVAAVNSYDEARALLEETAAAADAYADVITYVTSVLVEEGRDLDAAVTNEQMRMTANGLKGSVARIRAFLEKTK